MTQKQNDQLIKRVYEGLKINQVEPLLNSLAADVVWELPKMDGVPFSGIWRGHDGVRQFFDKVFELQDVLEFQPNEYFARGNKVVVLGRFTMRIKSTQTEFSSLWSHVWTIRDDKVFRFYEYVDTAVVSKAHTEAKTAQKAA
jgi:ketosteroid isomerase-like protein